MADVERFLLFSTSKSPRPTAGVNMTSGDCVSVAYLHQGFWNSGNC